MKSDINILLLAIIFFFPGMTSLLSQNRNLAIVDRCLERRSQFESLNYTMELKHKTFAADDTIELLANIELVRNNKDSLFGGTCIIDMDSIWFGYDGLHLLKATPQKGNLVMVDAKQHPIFYIKGNLKDNFVDYGFLKLSQGLRNYLQEPDINVTFSDTIIGEWPCLGIFFQLPDEGDIINQTFFMAIDTIEYLFRNKMYSAYFQGNQQYTNWDYRQAQYGHKTLIERLQESNLAAFKDIVQYESDTTNRESLATFDFSLMMGKVLIKDDTFVLKDVQAKFIILDFWYTSCYPCIKSIPAVSKIYQHYKDKGVSIYGVNPVDDPVESKSRLEKFIKNNPMGYQTIMVDKKIGNAVCDEGYPTFIILDRDYKVVFKEAGYNENLFQEVSTFLDVALKQ